MSSRNGHVQQIPITELRPGPWQPRRVFDAAALEELAQSMKIQGVLSPLRVVRGAAGLGYFIVAGERRWRAAAQVGIREVPCFIVDPRAGESDFRELAILDNLHRANLRPAEESRAIRELAHLGLRQRVIAERLGKSPAWVSQRLAMAKLPEIAHERLDEGTISREEALALTKLLHYPELVEACLEPTGGLLRAHVAGHVPEGVGERAQAALRALEIERLREHWVRKMRAEGHVVLDEVPRDTDRRYARLMQGSEPARAHQKAGLSCEAWVWENGGPTRLCTRPAELSGALASHHTDPIDLARQVERQRVLQREAARDNILKAWLATSRRLESSDLLLLARQRIRTLTSGDEGLLALLGAWLGATGDRATLQEAAENEIDRAGERRLVQLWFAIECAKTMSQAIVPAWAAPWLKRLGLVEGGGHSLRTMAIAGESPQPAAMAAPHARQRRSRSRAVRVE